MGSGDVSKVGETGDLVATVVLAFAADPFVRWLLPNPARFVATFFEITRLHGRRTAEHGGAWARGDRRGAAFWYPPGVHPDGEALGALFEQAGIADRMAGVFGEAAAYEPAEPHWYLRQIGVDPACQRSGCGGALLAAALVEIDERGEPAYLEATSEAGVALYQRHGSTVAGTVQVDDSPPLWPMTRAPR
jgi:ribosomal protein S18 acetylase RimI-like enzyme